MYYVITIRMPSTTFAGKSNLTSAQLETLRIELSRRRHEITMEEALKKRKISGISRGSYYRVLNQAKSKIRASIFTIAAAVRLGVIDVEDVRKLVLAASSIPEGLDPKMLAEVSALVNSLAERIVMSRL